MYAKLQCTQSSYGPPSNVHHRHSVIPMPTISNAAKRFKYLSLLLYRLRASSSLKLSEFVSPSVRESIDGGRHAGSNINNLRLPERRRSMPTTVTECRGLCNKIGIWDVTCMPCSGAAPANESKKYASTKPRSVDHASLPSKTVPAHGILRLKSKASACNALVALLA